MTQYVALFRGINIGRAKRLAMADLRKLMEAHGFTRVRTVLNSGNLLFASAGKAGLAGEIKAAVEEELGVSSHVIVLSAAELLKVVAENDLSAAADPSRLLVIFPDTAITLQAVAPLVASDWADEALCVGSRAAYLWCPSGILESKLNAAVSRALGNTATARNWATVGKIAALLTK